MITLDTIPTTPTPIRGKHDFLKINFSSVSHIITAGVAAAYTVYFANTTHRDNYYDALVSDYFINKGYNLTKISTFGNPNGNFAIQVAAKEAGEENIILPNGATIVNDTFGTDTDYRTNVKLFVAVDELAIASTYPYSENGNVAEWEIDLSSIVKSLIHTNIPNIDSDNFVNEPNIIRSFDFLYAAGFEDDSVNNGEFTLQPTTSQEATIWNAQLKKAQDIDNLFLEPNGIVKQKFLTNWDRLSSIPVGCNSTNFAYFYAKPKASAISKITASTTILFKNTHNTEIGRLNDTVFQTGNTYFTDISMASQPNSGDFLLLSYINAELDDIVVQVDYYDGPNNRVYLLDYTIPTFQTGSPHQAVIYAHRPNQITKSSEMNSPTSGVWYFPTGTANNPHFQNDSTFRIEDLIEYSFTIVIEYADSSTSLFENMNFKLIDQAKVFEVLFLNDLGGFDTMPFFLPYNEVFEINSESYTQAEMMDNDLLQGGTRTLNTSGKNIIKVTSEFNFDTKQLRTWLKEFVSSTEMLLLIDNQLHRITPTRKSYPIRNFNNKVLLDFEFTLNYTK